jgi:monooxygenase
MYDAIIVGSRVAGAASALLLARRGLKVLCVDRASFPSDTISTHMISVAGCAQLRRWGLLDKVAATGCPSVTNIDLDVDFPRYGHFVLSGFPEKVDDGFAAIYAPKRTILDKLLVDEARASGAEVRENFVVQELLRENGVVVGIRGVTGGRTVIERARIVVGADGINSLVAKSVQAPEYHTVPPLAFGYYCYWADVPLNGLEFYTRPGGTVIAFPTHDEHSAIFVERPSAEFANFKKDILGSYTRSIETFAPGLAERFRGGSQRHRLVGAGNRRNFFRKPGGAGWALVGDAGAHKDPITAQGITDAFRDAQLLADAIYAWQSGAQQQQEAMDEYERARNKALLPLYGFIVDHAAMEPFDDVFQDVLAALRGDRRALNEFFGVIQNTVSWESFFTPQNLSRLLAGGGESQSVG